MQKNISKNVFIIFLSTSCNELNIRKFHGGLEKEKKKKKRKVTSRSTE